FVAPVFATRLPNYAEKNINTIIDNLRKTFPHIDDVDKPFFRKLAQKLAVIWERSLDFSLETLNNPYVKLNQSPSIFKICLPYGVTEMTRDGIDLRFPPFEANTEMIYMNPLYHDPQFQETVNLSEGGKTSTTFAIAAEHWAIHVDCSHIISDYNNQLSSELVAVKVKCPSFNNIPLQELALRKLDIVFASRVLILIKMYVEQKIKTPKDWLLAQLYGLDKDSITLIYENLSELSAEEFSSLIRFINKCLNIGRILFIQDEAQSQCLCRPEFREYFGGITSVGKFDAPRKVHLVLKLPYLSPDDVIRVLTTVINVDGASPETLSYLRNIPKGRPQNYKDDEFVKTSKKWFEQMSNSIAGYLRNTAKSAGAELIQHGILPIHSPPFITLNPHKIDSLSFKVNGDLES
ncbi:4744_t:CDS:2, partial [Rhizophagus irregularis]